MQRLVRISYRGQGNAVAIDVVFKFLWYMRYIHNLLVAVCQSSKTLASFSGGEDGPTRILPELDELPRYHPFLGR